MTVPQTMTAVRITAHGGLEALQVAEVPVPEPAPGEVLVRVSAAAVNNTDLWTREGAYGLPGDPDALAGWRGAMEFPRIQGADVVGTVVALGADCAPGLLGTRVVVDPAIYDGEGADAHPVGLMGSERDGGYAQYVTAPAARVHDVADSPLDDDQLAALPTSYGTALGMIERGGVRSGDTVLVTGASGGVGLALVQLARARGATVLAVSSAGKIDQVREAGADHVLDRAEPVLPQLEELAPAGIDVALDVVAGDLLEQGLAHLAEGGRWVVAGAIAGYGIGVDIRRLYLHNIQLLGSSMHTPRHFELLMEIARRGEVHPVIAETHPLVDAAAAQEHLGHRSHVGKIVLHP